MKLVSQHYKSGAIGLQEVAPPALKAGGVLVRTHFSVVSSGTEGMKVREGRLSYIGKARARPDQVKKVLATVRQQGLVAAYQKAMNKLDSLTPLGYSLGGEVVAVGEGVTEFHVGQRVACAGAGYANHAEVNFVPVNLAVPIPLSVSTKHAAFATVGAIALQGYRQAEMQLGETACVIGLGLLGQLLVQILRAGGMHAIGIDIVPSRCELAVRVGAKAALTPADPGLPALIKRMTDGQGVDCVFIAAGGASNAPVEMAATIARDRARIVDIGKTRLDLPWNDYYLKELDVRFSRSYGPGRYDPLYEEHGIDYPIGYVRWTERRNLAAFLDLLAEGKIDLDAMNCAVRPFTEAEQVYQELATSAAALATVFDYTAELATPVSRLLSTPRAQPASARIEGRLNLGLIGAGNYASSMLLPYLKDNSAVKLAAVATTSSLSAENARQKFGFARATTDFNDVLADPAIDAVIIATRHSSHAKLVCAALRAGKATYVEKPLALTLEELRDIRLSIVESGNARLMVGFNRRFAPLIGTIAERFKHAQTPLVLQYRVHAGQLTGGSWYLDTTEGSRFAGEAGHFFDVLAYLTRSRPVAVSAACLRPGRATPDDLDNVVATVSYENGSVGSVSYLTQGGSRLPKEQLEVFGGGCAARLENFEAVGFYGDTDSRRVKSSRLDKGQGAQLNAFIAAAQGRAPMPIPLECLFDTTLTTLGVAQALGNSGVTDVRELWSRLER
jgi:predicted dehydrogenase/threonine dehydrogenase-like Zn-dependent dehydrogenase